MKRITAIIFAMMFFLSMPIISFADDIYIVDDEEDVFVPEIPTTKPAETTTAKQSDSGLGDFGSLGDYFDSLSGMLGDGIDSILSEFENGFGDFQPENNNNDGDDSDNQLQPIKPGSDDSVTVQSAVTTVPQSQSSDGQAVLQENTTSRTEELPSVLVVNQSDDSNDRISGSTLTILVFVAAIVVVIFVGAVVLVIMTKRTEYNSSVKSRSAIPAVEQPSALAQFMDDDIKDDGKDYGNITYWDKE